METSTETRIKGIATVRPLLPDEISAIVAIERHLGNPLNEIKFVEQADELDTDALMDEGFFPIEIGKFRYNLVKNSRNNTASSALESSLIMIGCEDIENQSPGEQVLVSIFARRNEDGYMNKFRMSLPRILGNLYDLGYDEMELIKRFKDVVRVFLINKDNRANLIPPERDDRSMAEEILDLVERTKKDFSPFTIGCYLRCLWRLGQPVEQIREKVGFWLSAWDKWQEAYSDAEKNEWPKIEKVNFSAGNYTGTSIQTDNRFISKVGSQTVDIFINRRLDGHAAIMTRKLRMTNLNRELEKIEPGKWYYHKPTGHLINGGASKPSSLSSAQLIELVQKFPPR